jgi:hypothetical protein
MRVMTAANQRVPSSSGNTKPFKKINRSWKFVPEIQTQHLRFVMGDGDVGSNHQKALLTVSEKSKKEHEEEEEEKTSCCRIHASKTNL